MSIGVTFGAYPINDKTPTKIPEHDRYRSIAVPWADDIKYTRGDLVLRSDSFQAWVDEYVKFLIGSPIKKTNWNAQEVKKKGIAVGDDKVLYYRRYPFGGMQQRWIGPVNIGGPVWMKNTIPIVRAAQTVGCATFDDDVYILILANRVDLDPWMSLTPGEIIGQRGGVRKAKGNVLMAGAGLGWLSRKVLQKSTVASLHIVEKDAAVVDLLRPAFERDFKGRVKFSVCDIWTFLQDKRSNVAEYDSMLFDIWEGASDATYDSKFLHLRSLRPDAWAWGFSAREERY